MKFHLLNALSAKMFALIFLRLNKIIDRYLSFSISHKIIIFPFSTTLNLFFHHFDLCFEEEGRQTKSIDVKFCLVFSGVFFLGSLSGNSDCYKILLSWA